MIADKNIAFLIENQLKLYVENIENGEVDDWTNSLINKEISLQGSEMCNQYWQDLDNFSGLYPLTAKLIQETHGCDAVCDIFIQ